jgi:3alpha(or 20beta)-hydroxysteroid dehydrogenase
MERIPNKVVLISGAARGIGAAAARRLHDEGAKIIIGDVLKVEGEALAHALGPRATYVHLDVTSKASWDSAVSVAEKSFGPLNVLINNAGIAHQGYIKDLPLEDYQRVININQTGVFLGMQAAYPSLRKSSTGSIINVSSIYGLVGDIHSMAYVASKFAVRAMTKVAALEFGRFGIRVNSIHPGLIKTPMTGAESSDLAFGFVPLQKRDTAPDKAGQPDDIANMMLFLASDESTYANGAEFVIDGGLTLNRETKAKQEYYSNVQA